MTLGWLGLVLNKHMKRAKDDVDGPTVSVQDECTGGKSTGCEESELVVVATAQTGLGWTDHYALRGL